MTRTQVNQWPIGNAQIATTVHHVDEAGEETIELTGIHERMALALADADRGHEMVLAERMQAGHR
jgi:hypothetical protein